MNCSLFLFVSYLQPIVAAMLHQARRALNATKHEYLQLKENVLLNIHP